MTSSSWSWSECAGPPGCGKGTQSEQVKGEWGLAHLATGDMLRAQLAAHTPLGTWARDDMDKVVES